MGLTLGLLEVSDHDEPLLGGPVAEPDVFDLKVLVDLAEPALPRAGLDDLRVGAAHPFGDDEARPATGQDLAVGLR